MTIQQALEAAENEINTQQIVINWEGPWNEIWSNT